MRDIAAEAIAFSIGRARADLDADRLLQLALIRLVEVIGEAATRIPPDMRAAHASLPWHQIVSARNRLIHGYDNNNLNIVWSIIQNDLPVLVLEIERILADDKYSTSEKT